MNKKNSLNPVLLTALILLIICSCSQYKSVSCPDFSKNKNYSATKRDYPVVKKQFHSKKKRNFLAFNRENELFKKKSKRIVVDSFEKSVAEKPDNHSNYDNVLLTNLNDESSSVLIPSNEKHTVFLNELNERNPGKEVIGNSPADKPLNRYVFNKRSTKKEVKKQLKDIIHSEDKNKNSTTQQPVKDAEGFAITSLILGILGLFIAGIPLGILATIFGSIALSRVNRNPGLRGRGLAIAGLVLGIIDIVGALIAISILM